MRRLAALAALVIFSAASLARADVPQLSPNLYERGNLRVAIACAGNGLLDPVAGLRLTLDGEPLRALHVNDVASVGVDDDGNEYVASAVTDVGFLAPAGHHHLRIEAPDCDPDERDVDLSAVYAVHVEGRLAARAELRSPTAAPDGFGFAIGGTTFAFPRALASGTNNVGLFATSYTTDPSSAQGVWVSMQVDRRAWTFAFDTSFMGGSVTGTVTSTSSDPVIMNVPGPFPYSGSFIENASVFRFGGRVPWGNLSLSAGSGLGGALVIRTSSHVDTGSTPSYDTFATAPDGADVDWWLPVWASLSVKPACNWGVQALASYDLHPTTFDASAPSFALGLLYQPSSACSEPAGMTVSP